MSRNLLLLSALAAFAVFLPASPAAADLDVVATTPDLAAVVREVGGEHVEVTALALPTQDPHFVDARPHLALALARADLLVAIGLGLEVGWLPTLQTGSRNGDIQRGARGYLNTSSAVDRLEVRGRVDRSEGDVHPGGNPHFMLDPRRVVRVADRIAARMAELDPEHAASYIDNLARFRRRVDRERSGWERRLSSLRGAKVIAYHRSFPYLADWLGLSIVAHIEPRPGIPPNPRHVARVMIAAARERVRVLLQESWYPSNTAQLVSERTGARLAVIPGGPDVREGQTYFEWMNRLVSVLARASQ